MWITLRTIFKTQLIFGNYNGFSAFFKAEHIRDLKENIRMSGMKVPVEFCLDVSPKLFFGWNSHIVLLYIISYAVETFLYKFTIAKTIAYEQTIVWFISHCYFIIIIIS